MEKYESKNKIILKTVIKTRKNMTKNYSYILLFIFLFPILSINKNLSNTNFISEMTLKIKGNGNQKIFKINATYINLFIWQ